MTIRNFRFSAIGIMLMLIPFTQAFAQDNTSLIAMSNPANPGAVADAYLSHARAIRKADAPIVHLLNHSAYTQAVPLLKKAAADKYDFWAADTLGHLYQAGLGVSANSQTAFHWYLQAAEAGDRFAQRQVANAYLNGWGVTRNPQRAAFWFRQGLMVPQVANADFWLGKTYAAGKLMPKNPTKAAWYEGRSLALLKQLDAEHVGAAAYDLGIAYWHGYGFKKDAHQAEQYFRRALAEHYPPAAAALQHLEEKNT
ncbi:sel1 repeat family protein [Acidithiobacillus thiooxidans]|uniref:tetratricopeptide repeat protein n=1 Tax=Acidithiobacillus thiooxidans TaxID=930 RepID=UPI000493DF48|nr:tetratricopeptide repeat protein [Acidithiobacillus thiooxidans]MBU2811578.1 sel1 repeat family protein [Acidithiobacillus thiooxidans]